VAKLDVFADTSGWLSAFVHTEPHHSTAADYLRKWRRERRRVVTTNYVITELAALYVNRIRSPRAQQVNTIETIRSADWVEVIVVDATLDLEGWDLFKARPDKSWSLVDCVSFVIMQQRGITDALTEDHHFEQAGFVSLLRPNS
jgi:uncharacterized protein